MKKAGIAYFTEQGGRLAHRIADGLAPEYEILLYEKGLKDWCAACFAKAELIIFIGACGIAVRTIAPLLKSKTEDPAVLVLDEAGQYVISLLSGHIGGANAYAQKIAGLTGATPVITTKSRNTAMAAETATFFCSRYPTWSESEISSTGMATISPIPLWKASALLLVRSGPMLNASVNRTSATLLHRSET